MAGKPAGFRVWLLRQMILSAHKGADKIRLTALPKPLPSIPHCRWIISKPNALSLPRKSA